MWIQVKWTILRIKLYQNSRIMLGAKIESTEMLTCYCICFKRKQENCKVRKYWIKDKQYSKFNIIRPSNSLRILRRKNEDSE